MYIKAQIVTDAHDAEVLPEEPVVNVEGLDYIFTTSEVKTFQITKVNAGIAQNGYTAIQFKQPNPTKKFVVKGAYPLLSKLQNTEGESLK